MKNWRTTVSGITAALLSLLAMAATVPSELQAQLMAMMPKQAQPYTALFFAVAAFIAKSYNAQASADAATVANPATVQPVVKDSLTPQPEAKP